MLSVRRALQNLDELCQDQQTAMTDWSYSLDTWIANKVFEPARLVLLKNRTHNILEHIARIIGQIDRMEQSADVAVQLHFNAQSNRTNDIMRTLTVVTTIFLPLNLITGFFGMNFVNFPLLHTENGLGWTVKFMVLLALVLALVVWKRRLFGVLMKSRRHDASNHA